MDFETPTLEPQKEVHLEWPAEFNAEEVRILEEAAAVYNTMNMLNHMAMSDTGETLLNHDQELIAKAKDVAESKGYELNALIRTTQEAMEK